LTIYDIICRMPTARSSRLAVIMSDLVGWIGSLGFVFATVVFADRHLYACQGFLDASDGASAWLALALAGVLVPIAAGSSASIIVRVIPGRSAIRLAAAYGAIALVWCLAALWILHTIFAGSKCSLLA
jgi:hypothetical protein